MRKRIFLCIVFSWINILSPFMLYGQEKKDSIFNFSISRIATPTDSIYVPRIFSSIYHDGYTYVLIDNKTKRPVIKVYNLDADLISTNSFLAEKYSVKEFFKYGNRFIICGIYTTGYIDTLQTNESLHKAYWGFVAELSDKFEAINIKLLKGIFPMNVIKHKETVYLLGEMSTSEITINDKKIKSYAEIEETKEKLDYPDVVLLKLNSDFDILNITHFGIDGHINDVQSSIVLNNNGYAAFSVNTTILRGADHHDGNLFMVDSNFKMSYHIQYSDFSLGENYATVIRLNDKNEVLCNINAHYALKSNINSALNYYNPKNIKKNLTEMKFKGIVSYDTKGNIINKQKTDFRFSQSFFLGQGKGPTLRKIGEPNNFDFVLCHGMHKDSVALSFFTLSTNGEIYSQYSIPKKIPPFFYYYNNGNDFKYRWKLISVKND